MNGKRIAKIISEEIMKSLYQFSDVITESYKCLPEAETEDYRRFKYNMCHQTKPMRKIDSLKFGGYDKLGFDIEISEPTFNISPKFKRIDLSHMSSLIKHIVFKTPVIVCFRIWCTFIRRSYNI